MLELVKHNFADVRDIIQRSDMLDRLRNIPVIMLTARHYLEDEEMTAKHAGQFVSYVVKPFIVRELVQEVRKVLSADN